MKGKPIVAGLLSLIAPGLGHIYRGEGNKGAMILFGAIVIANTIINILPLIRMAHTELPPVDDVNALWSYWIPRITHDFAALWSVIYWIWAIVDAFRYPCPIIDQKC